MDKDSAPLTISLTIKDTVFQQNFLFWENKRPSEEYMHCGKVSGTCKGSAFFVVFCERIARF